MQRRTLPLLFLAVAGLLASACHVSFAASFPTVDGVELELQHVETLAVTGLESDGFQVDATLGDVRIEHTDGASSLTVELFERTAGDAYAVLENGRLVSASHSGEPTAIGDVVLRTAGPLSALAATTGVGNVELQGVKVLGTGDGDFVDLVRFLREKKPHLEVEVACFEAPEHTSDLLLKAGQAVHLLGPAHLYRPSA